ncbi:superoxide dismutase, partial [Kineococcus glutinatus]|uniref:superoxide dismutase n=1 Tax=Kineococcus glutinatus TaxID=1070872 RepID=UPI0031F0C032
AAAAAPPDQRREDQHREDRRAFPETVPLPAGSQPEGITDGPGTTFFAGSRTDGGIWRGDLRTGRGEVLVPGVPGRVAVGVRYEERAQRLWVAGGATGAVTAYDARTGAELGRWVVPGSGFLNDVEVTRDAVYVTDSSADHLVVIPLGRRGQLPAEAATLPLTGDFDPVPGAFNLNGVRALPDGALVATQSVTGDLFRIDPGSGATTRLAVSGVDLAGGDGLVLRGRTLYVVYGFATDEVAVVRLARDLRSGEVTGRLGDDDLDRPTTGILAGGSLWLVNGRFSTPATPTTPYDVVRVDLCR